MLNKFLGLERGLIGEGVLNLEGGLKENLRYLLRNYASNGDPIKYHAFSFAKEISATFREVFAESAPKIRFYKYTLSWKIGCAISLE